CLMLLWSDYGESRKLKSPSMPLTRLFSGAVPNLDACPIGARSALTAAKSQRGSLKGAIFHSDHGSVYTSQAFQDTCTALGVTQSMGAIGASADNALAESFNASMKREVLQDPKTFTSQLVCRREVLRWRTRYNTVRRHSW